MYLYLYFNLHTCNSISELTPTASHDEPRFHEIQIKAIPTLQNKNPIKNEHFGSNKCENPRQHSWMIALSGQRNRFCTERPRSGYIACSKDDMVYSSGSPCSLTDFYRDRSVLETGFQFNLAPDLSAIDLVIDSRHSLKY